MKKLFIISVFCTMTALSAVAQEGMWMLSQLGQLDLARKG